MSVSSCEMNCGRSNSGSDFYCTEEELFDSFMEIVNDPELQERSEGEVQGDLFESGIQEEIDKKKSSETQENMLGETNKDMGYMKDHEYEKSACDTIVSEIPSSEKDLDKAENEYNMDKIEITQSGSVDQIDTVLVNLQESENHVCDNVNQNGFSDIANVVKSAGFTGELKVLEESDPKTVSMIDSKNTKESAKNVDSLDVNGKDNNTSNQHAKVNDLGQDFDIPGIKDDNEGNSDSENLQSIENNEYQTNTNNEDSLNPDKEPSNENDPAELNKRSQGMSQNEVNTMSGQQQTNQDKAISTNQNEEESILFNENAVESNCASYNEVEPADQTELQKIENNIEEGIRKANQVCEELNAIMQRLSQSSDELLGDGDSKITLKTETMPEVSRNEQVAENNINSKEWSDSTNPETRTDESWRNTDTNKLSSEGSGLESKPTSFDVNHSTQPDIDLASVNVLSSDGCVLKEVEDSLDKPPNTLPKLIITNQMTELTPSHNIASPGATSLDSATSPLGISPTQMIHVKDVLPDREQSMSDSLDSSEGSLSGDTKSTGTPTEACGPINWDVLNSAFEHPDSDEDEAVYEPSGHYGGFGLVHSDDSEDTISQSSANDEPLDMLTVDGSRFRSVSQSSTISEVEFQKEFKKSHNIDSLERKIDGVLCSGYLFKLGGTGITPKNWRKRWCVLRRDRCLYYYKSAKDKIPCGIVVLANYIVSHSSECNKKNCIKISKGGGRTYFFSSETSKDMLSWMEALRKAASNTDEGTSFIIRKEIIHNVAIPALSIKKPDCHGYLTKQGGKSTRSWKRRYCVLKNGCLYYYREMADTTALGVAKLHGYTVDDVSLTGRRNGFRCVPPHSGMRTFIFVADNEYDKKRWIPCFRESIRTNTPTDSAEQTSE